MIFPNSQSICYLVHFHISLETFLPFILFYRSAAPQINFQIYPSGVDFRPSRYIADHINSRVGQISFADFKQHDCFNFAATFQITF